MIDYEEKFEEVGESLYHSKIGGYSLEFIDYLKSQLKEKDIEIESQLTKIYALNARVSHRGFENLNITRLARKSSETIEQLRKMIAELKGELKQRTNERDNHFRDIIKLENELSELIDNGDSVYSILEKEHEALKAKIAGSQTYYAYIRDNTAWFHKVIDDGNAINQKYLVETEDENNILAFMVDVKDCLNLHLTDEPLKVALLDLTEIGDDDETIRKIANH